ncbi:NlpC/P60 family protein [Streptomyces sp. LX-29]|uniref:C40 family peptidase n=1 Tax=Streptomyces sp. LX-29 TaxID=2900152 RepID=UPI00240D2047|nr:C40 family peptidase [Streptomyces sp. LX-29]WFB07436.1 NlpC/P60 family protein [Streptomyces sp. LX-29]
MSGRLRRTIRAVSLAATVALLPPPTVAVADPPEAEASVADLLTRLQGLYQKAEEATEKFNEVEEKLAAQRKRTSAATRRLAGARTALVASREAAGRLAREQYRGSGGLGPTVQALLAGDAKGVTDRRHEMRRASTRQAAVVERLIRGERRADRLAHTARAALEKRQALAAKRKKQRDKVTRRLREIEETLSSLTEEQLAELRREEERETDEAQRELLESGLLGPVKGPARAPSADGRQALRYAVRQLGKPYVWGAEGPASFDCSGLTSRAWAQAGRPIPRTSQEQWRRLHRVPLRELRPGDLVLYFPGATHVALYAGAGMVVQAPRPGTDVRLSPIAGNPLLGAVRPDHTPRKTSRKPAPRPA